MAVTAEVDIANSVLIKLGQTIITAAQYAAANKKPAKQIVEIYAKRRDEVLQAFPWNFATLELRLIKEDHYDRVALTGVTAANPVVITITSHGFPDGAKIAFDDPDDEVVGMTDLNDTYYWLNNVAANTAELQNEDGDNIDGTGYTAWASGGQDGFRSLSMNINTFYQLIA